MVLLVLSLLPIAVVTLMPGDAGSAALDSGARICVFCGSRATADALLNVLLFLPFGWVLGRRKSAWRVVGWAALLSAGVEVAQLFLLGRYTSAADVAANTLGAGLGAWTAATRHRPGRVAVAASLTALFAPALLLEPAPPEGAYYGQWTAVFENMEAYRGRILEARAAGVGLPSRKTPHGKRIRTALRRGEPFHFRVEVGPAPPGPAPVFSVADGRGKILFMLGADGHDVFVRLWRRGTSLRLQTPEWWWKGALEDAVPGDTLAVVYRLAERGPCLDVGERTRCVTATSAAGSWSLLAPGGQDGLLFLIGSLIWAFVLGLPLGLMRISRPARGLSILVILASVLVLSRVLPYWPTPYVATPLFLLGAATAMIGAGKLGNGPDTTPKRKTTTT